MNLSASGLLLVVLATLNTCIAQTTKKKERGYTHQLTSIGDNDVLAFKGTDRYYTNGLFFQYTSLRASKGKNTIKQTNEWELGQQIYNAYRREVYTLKDLDRPIAGYLYGKYSISKFKTNNQLWKYGVSVGTIGKASLAEQLTNFFHPLVKINSTWWGWIYDYQVKTEVGVNVHGKYSFSAIKNNSGFFQVTSETGATAGTSFINLSQSLLFQLGKFNQMHESAYWNASLSKEKVPTKNKKEIFFFYKPEVVLQGYDATIQGGMFRKDKGESASSPEPFVVYNNAGVMYSGGRFMTSFQYTIQTREAKTQRNNHEYGRVSFGYRFR